MANEYHEHEANESDYIEETPPPLPSGGEYGPPPLPDAEAQSSPAPEPEPLPPAVPPPSGPLPVLCLVFTFVAFLPVLCLIPLILGLVALKRCPRLSIRAIVAAGSGGFFTILYILAIIGRFLPREEPPEMPGFAFLAEADPAIQAEVDLMEQGDFEGAVPGLERRAAAKPPENAAALCALAIVKKESLQYEEAASRFDEAFRADPGLGAEAHFYRGRNLEAQAKHPEAAASFRAALERDPSLEIAQRQLELVENSYQPSKAVSVIATVVILLFLFTCHECAHAFTAWRLGDPTAKSAGRITLNPIAHLDLIGSIVLPGILLATKSDFVFGWAKPVPVNPRNFKYPQHDHMAVAFAGPGVNLAIAMAVGFVMFGGAFITRIFAPGAISSGIAYPFCAVAFAGVPAPVPIAQAVFFLKELVFTSLILGCFNLIPVPPLDGSWVFSGILPGAARRLFERLRGYGFIIFLILLFTHVLDVVLAVPVLLFWAVSALFLGLLGFA